jgi:hypothetical protein
MEQLQGDLYIGLLSTLSNGIVGSIISYYIYEGGIEFHGINKLVMGLIVTGQSILTSVFWAGMITNMLDKLLSAAAAFGISLLNKKRGCLRSKMSPLLL